MSESPELPRFKFKPVNLVYEYAVLVDDVCIGFVKQYRPWGQKKIHWLAMDLDRNVLLAECQTRKVAAKIVWEERT